MDCIAGHQMYEKLQGEVDRQLAAYNRGDKASKTDVIETIRAVLHDKAWVWVGQQFVKPDQVAFESRVSAPPFLYVLPRELAFYRTLLVTYGVRETFGASDFVAVLAGMATRQTATVSAE
jgi:hypothetical protein